MIPDFQEVMPPFLKVMADGKEWQMQELIDTLALKFNLSNEERQERIPNGQKIFNNHVRQVRTRFNHAGFIKKSPINGSWRITQLGLDVVK